MGQHLLLSFLRVSLLLDPKQPLPCALFADSNPSLLTALVLRQNMQFCFPLDWLCVTETIPLPTSIETHLPGFVGSHILCWERQPFLSWTWNFSQEFLPCHKISVLFFKEETKILCSKMFRAECFFLVWCWEWTPGPWACLVGSVPLTHPLRP